MTLERYRVVLPQETCRRFVLAPITLSAAAEGQKQYVVIDDDKGKVCDGITVGQEGSTIFDTSDRLNYIAIPRDSVCRVEERIEW